MSTDTKTKPVEQGFTFSDPILKRLPLALSPWYRMLRFMVFFYLLAIVAMHLGGYRISREEPPKRLGWVG